MDNIVIKLSGVSKRYILHHEKPTLAESLFRKKEEFWALRDVSLAVKKGDKLGIIGLNGAGKSTLLKIIVGITVPTRGEVETKGRIASLIALEAGFHPDLTGEENVYINGLLLGMSKQRIKESFKSIVNFSGIKKFIDSPLHTFSAGMKLRLGFSVAIHADPDILVIDEVIATGDKEFEKKSYKKMQEFFKKKKTILFVSHDLKAVKKLCSKTLWIEKGRVKLFGPTKKVIARYKG